MKRLVSKFAGLRPKWCIIAGPKNTHAVCVWSYHQNVKLLLSSIGIEHLYYVIIDMTVCNRDSKECVVHRCNKCLGIEKAYKFIQKILNGDVEDYLDFDVTFMQWVTIDRSNLITQTLSADNFLSFLCEKLDSITANSFIAKNQSQYLKKLKEELSQNEVTVQVDFAENHNFLVQDEVQSYHWYRQQCICI